MMNESDDTFLRRLIKIFKVESQDHVQALSQGVLDLEKSSPGAERNGIAEALLRRAHTLKGAARSVGSLEIQTLCQNLEGVLSDVQKGRAAFSSALFDQFHETIRLLESLSVALGEPGADAKSPDAAAKGFTGAAANETIRIPKAKLDALLMQAEELVPFQHMENQIASDLGGLQAMVSSWTRSWGRIRPDARAVRKAAAIKSGRGESEKSRGNSFRLVEFTEWNQGLMGSMEVALDSLRKSVNRNLRFLQKTTDMLLKDMKRTLMFPFSSVLDMLPRIAREIARDQGKEVDLSIEGGDIEVEKRILDEAKDCFIHLLRNSIGHGIEKPEVRLSAGKPARGLIRISISPLEGNRVAVEFSDNGVGFEPKRVLAAAIKQGVVSREAAEKMTGPEALSLIFLSGISTTPDVTELTGRGLGLAIVKEKIERLGGAISLKISSAPGAAFQMVLPMTMATLRGVLLRVQDGLFLAPIANVRKVARVRSADLMRLGNQEALLMDGRLVPLFLLSEIFALPASMHASDSSRGFPIAVLGIGDETIAIRVDEIEGELEILIKSLGRQLSRVRNIAGAALLGTGKTVLVLNIADLLKSAPLYRRAQRPVPLKSPAQDVEPKEEPHQGGKSILVVEDSLTSRVLLKSILESAGYQVVTAVDGIDALAKLKSGAIDAVVSDVDMPKMNGFVLTASIRSDLNLSSLPVLLITALESEEDRARGMEAGANAYLLKSRFDQSDFTDILERFL